jgi:hypothetical protein
MSALHGCMLCTQAGGTATPVICCAAVGNAAVVDALTKAGADVEAASDAGTPLLWAAGSGAVEVGRSGGAAAVLQLWLTWQRLDRSQFDNSVLLYMSRGGPSSSCRLSGRCWRRGRRRLRWLPATSAPHSWRQPQVASSRACKRTIEQCADPPAVEPGLELRRPTAQHECCDGASMSHRPTAALPHQAHVQQRGHASSSRSRPCHDVAANHTAEILML